MVCDKIKTGQYICNIFKDQDGSRRIKEQQRIQKVLAEIDITGLSWLPPYIECVYRVFY